MEGDSFKASFNMAQILISQIGNLLAQTNYNYVRGDIPLAFYCTQSIKMNIVQNLDQDERKKLNELESKLAELIENYNLVKRNKRDEAKVINKKIAGLYLKYKEEVMDLLNKYGYLVSERQDASKMVE